MLFFPTKFSNHVFEGFYNYCLNIEYSKDTRRDFKSLKFDLEEKFFNKHPGVFHQMEI